MISRAEPERLSFCPPTIEVVYENRNSPNVGDFREFAGPEAMAGFSPSCPAHPDQWCRESHRRIQKADLLVQPRFPCEMEMGDASSSPPETVSALVAQNRPRPSASGLNPSAAAQF